MEFSKTCVYGFDGAFRAMRNPLNSWGKSDSTINTCDEMFDDMVETWMRKQGELDSIEVFDWLTSQNIYCNFSPYFLIGPDDLDLAQRLILAGPEHSKFLRFITVQSDVRAPRYVWQEFDTYKFVEKSSCSTMHKLLTGEWISRSDFDFSKVENTDLIGDLIEELNRLRANYANAENLKEKNKILAAAKQILPESYLQLRTISTNYAELRNMYFQRKDHRLDDWAIDFVNWIKTLPYAEELIMLEKEN